MDSELRFMWCVCTVNKVGQAGAFKFAAAMDSNTTLQSLDLSGEEPSRYVGVCLVGMK